MSLQIPHREKAIGGHASTKAVILVSWLEQNQGGGSFVDEGK